ncbi:MAG: hypothetical protein IJF41_06965 [Clostridia bacterium]|nr:hypothetical protein [Clostridia bacterium]
MMASAPSIRVGASAAQASISIHSSEQTWMDRGRNAFNTPSPSIVRKGTGRPPMGKSPFCTTTTGRPLMGSVKRFPLSTRAVNSSVLSGKLIMTFTLLLLV